LYDVVVKKFTFAISSPDEFFVVYVAALHTQSGHGTWCWSWPIGQRCNPRLGASRSQNQSLRGWEKPKRSCHVRNLS